MTEGEAGVPGWRLTVCCTGGVSNRLRVLISGRALAERSGRAFRMLWPLNSRCGAPFGSLFANDWNVVDVAPDEGAALAGEGKIPDVLAERRPHVTLRHRAWLVRPGEYPAHDALWPRCLELLEALEPEDGVRARVERFRRERFRPEMIGVHLRRGDLRRVRPDVSGNTGVAIAEVERFLAERPDAGILLCTDDGAVDPVTRHVHHEGVAQAFTQRFGDRVVSTRPRSLDRQSPEALQDAVVDLLLLRHTQMFVGSQASSFSGLAVLGRDVPAVLCAYPHPGYVRFERLTRMTGLYHVLGAVGRLRYGRPVPFAVLWMWLVGKRLPARYQRPWRV